MTDLSAYAVFLHEQAIEALGVAIRPYLIDSPAGPHLQCVEVDSGGALFEMTLVGKGQDGRRVDVELMVPIAMIKLVVSVRRDADFGFGLRDTPAAAAAAVSVAAADPDAADPANPAPATDAAKTDGAT